MYPIHLGHSVFAYLLILEIYFQLLGMADTIPLMQMARQILQEYKYNPKDGEGLALLSSNALSMSEATLALHKYDKLFKMAEIGIALAILAENGKYLVNYLLGN